MNTSKGLEDVTLSRLSSTLLIVMFAFLASQCITRPRQRRSASGWQEGQQLLGGQQSVREARSIDLVRRMHAFMAEGSGRILHEGDVVAQLHAKTRGGFDAGVRDHADENDLLDPPLFKL